MGEGKRKGRVAVEDDEGEQFFVMDVGQLRVGKGKRVMPQRKYTSTVMIQPHKGWIPPLPGLIEVKQVGTGGAPVFSLMKTSVYDELDKQFAAIQDTMDIQLLF